MDKKPLNIVIADDNRFFCEALKDSLQQHANINVIAFFTSIQELINCIGNFSFDVLILDINFNGKSSLDALHKIKKENTNFKIIALTTLNNNFIKSRTLDSGVDVFVGKDTDLSNFKDLIFDCFYNNKKMNNTVNSHKIIIDNLIFTKRKLEILQALYEYSGLKEKELSEVLSISESALKSHKRELFEITNTKNTPELIKFGIQNSLIVA